MKWLKAGDPVSPENWCALNQLTTSFSTVVLPTTELELSTGNRDVESVCFNAQRCFCVTFLKAKNKSTTEWISSWAVCVCVHFMSGRVVYLEKFAFKWLSQFTNTKLTASKHKQSSLKHKPRNVSESSVAAATSIHGAGCRALHPSNLRRDHSLPHTAAREC